MTKRKSILIGLTLILLTGGSVGLMLATKPTPPKKPVEQTSPLVSVASPVMESVTFEVEAHGVVQARTETTLISEVSGVIQQVSSQFVSGGYFKKGDLLLQIDPSDYRVGVEQTKAHLASVKAKYAQEEAKAEQARQEWDLTGRSRDKAPLLALREPFLLEAKANVESAEADLKKAEQKLSRTSIRAPYDGMVKEKRADVGQFVATGSQLGVTFAVDYAEIRLPLSDHDLAFINQPGWGANQQVGQSEVEIRSNYAGQESRWMGQLVRMEGMVNEQSRVHYAVARVTDPYGIVGDTGQKNPLKIGSFVTAKIKGRQVENLVKLPRVAFKDLDRILVSDKDNKLYYRDLNVVRAESEFVYVDAGIEQGDRVVLTSIESPVQGMALRIEGEQPIADPEVQVAEEAYAQKP